MIRLALVAAGGLILALTGASVVGIWLSPFELAQNFAPHLLMLGIATLAFLSCFRLWRWAGATLLCLTWHAYLYLPNSGAGPWKTMPNIGRLLLVETSSQRMIDYARDVAPELIVVADRSDGSHDHLPDLLPLYPNAVGLDAASGKAILAKSEVQLEPVPSAAGDQLPILLAHATVGDKRFYIVVVHLARPFPLGPIGLQREQARLIGEVVSKLEDPVLMLGDFNAAPWTTTMAKLNDGNRFRFDLGAATWPAWAPARLRLPLDQLLMSGKLVGVAKAGPDLGSSHLPVIATLGLWTDASPPDTPSAQ